MSYATFTRVSDSSVLNVGDNAGVGHADQSWVTDYPGLHGFAFQRAYAGGYKGQSKPIATAYSQRTFTIVIRISDPTGAEQALIENFFQDEGYFTLVDSEHSIANATFTVVALEPAYFTGKDEISITCQLQKGFMASLSYDNFQSYSLASGATGSQSTSRTVSKRSTIAVSVETASAVAWNPFTLTLTGVVSGASNSVSGVLASTTTRNLFFLDSLRGFCKFNGLPPSGSGDASFFATELGDGLLSGGSTTFSVPKGSTINLTIAYSALPAAATIRVWELSL